MATSLDRQPPHPTSHSTLPANQPAPDQAAPWPPHEHPLLPGKEGWLVIPPTVRHQQIRK